MHASFKSRVYVTSIKTMIYQAQEQWLRNFKDMFRTSKQNYSVLSHIPSAPFNLSLYADRPVYIYISHH